MNDRYALCLVGGRWAEVGNAYFVRHAMRAGSYVVQHGFVSWSNGQQAPNCWVSLEVEDG